MSKRTVVAVVVGFVAGLMVVVGTVLPWLSPSAPSDSSGFAESINGLSGVLGLVLIPLGVVIMVAATWLWAGSEQRRSAALLGPLGVAAAALALAILIMKVDAVGYGFLSSDENVGVEAGVYVILAGGVLAVAAAIVAALPGRAAAEPVGVEPAAPTA